MWKADFWFRRIGSRDSVGASGSGASFGTMPDIDVKPQAVIPLVSASKHCKQ
jgi:hypothetical protein